MKKQIEALLERIMDAFSQTVTRTYEQRIESLERNKLALAEKQERSLDRHGTFEELFELAFGFFRTLQNSGYGQNRVPENGSETDFF